MKKNKANGSSLLISIILVAVMSLIALSGLQLAVTAQTVVNRENDLVDAYNAGQMAIFDSSSGAVAKILAFESQTSFGALDNEARSAITSSLFKAPCINNVQNISGLNKGLCATAESSGYSSSLPLLRLSNNANIPCRSSVSSAFIDGGMSVKPMIEDADSKYSFSYIGASQGLCHSPNYIVEMLNTNFRIAKSNGLDYVKGARLYRVTAVGFGKNGKTRSFQEAYFYVVCPPTGCSISLLSHVTI